MATQDSKRKNSHKLKDEDPNTVFANPPFSPHSQPVSRVQWISREQLSANDYNPNAVAPPELELLKISILEDGWTQPIVILEDNTIVDGFHRWTVSADPRIFELTNGYVPCVVIKADKNHRMMSTIRHNRARGTHGILKMADIVEKMLRDGVSVEEICERVGMEVEEVERLANRKGLPLLHKDQGFGKAWIPNFDK